MCTCALCVLGLPVHPQITNCRTDTELLPIVVASQTCMVLEYISVLVKSFFTHLIDGVFNSAGLFTVDDVQSITDEILKMKHFDHPNVMTLVGVCVSIGGGPAIVMPFMANGSLLNYLRKDKKNITIKDDQDLETVSCTS